MSLREYAEMVCETTGVDKKTAQKAVNYATGSPVLAALGISFSRELQGVSPLEQNMAKLAVKHSIADYLAASDAKHPAVNILRGT